jgi:F-type H+-transporting ATPase subunit epsilon
MARPTYPLMIVKRDGPVYDGRASHVRAPGVEGYFGVLARHAPLVAELGVGVIEVTPPETEGGLQTFACSGGILQVQPEGKVVILADAAEPAHEIDLKRAEAAADRAREKLERARSDQEIDADRAAAALVRAINRLKVAKQQM